LTCVMACSRPLQVRVFNNTGGSIAIHVTAGSGFATTQKDIVVASGGLSPQFDYYYRYRGPFRISAAGCEIAYSLPLHLQGYALPNTYDVPVQVQIEPDLTIYLVRFDAKTVSDVRLSAQVQGFPLRPTSRTCSDGSKI
jgi:hypothetical protein